MELVVRGSEYQSFLTCRKQWYHQWVEGLRVKRPDNKLFFGTLFHKWLEHYYNSGCNKLQASMDTSLWFNEQDISGMQQTEIDELKSLFRGVRDYYDQTYRNSDSKWNILATELEFLVKLDEGVYMTGTIDLVYEVDGKIRFADHKTVSSISMYEEKSKMDRQISRYWWALNMIAKGIGRVKHHETGLWEQWLQIEGKEIDGFDYNLIAKDSPKEPKVLKSGALSTDKSQKTTYEMYRAKIRELGLDVNDYKDMLQMLADKPNQWLKRIDVQRTPQELEAAAWEFMYTAGDIHDVKLMVTENPQAVEPMTYRNIGTHCEHMCQFRELCKTTIEGGNVSLVKNLAYVKEEK